MPHRTVCTSGRVRPEPTAIGLNCHRKPKFLWNRMKSERDMRDIMVASSKKDNLTSSLFKSWKQGELMKNTCFLEKYSSSMFKIEIKRSRVVILFIDEYSWKAWRAINALNGHQKNKQIPRWYVIGNDVSKDKDCIGHLIDEVLGIKTTLSAEGLNHPVPSRVILMRAHLNRQSRKPKTNKARNTNGTLDMPWRIMSFPCTRQS